MEKLNKNLGWRLENEALLSEEVDMLDDDISDDQFNGCRFGWDADDSDYLANYCIKKEGN